MDDYQQTIRTLSDRIVLAQTPIRVLDAVKWDENIRKGFLKAKGKEMPAVDRDYYLNRPLSFDSSKVKLEFQNIERDITRQLGQFNPVGQIMRRMCKEYRMVVRMLEARGTEDFGLISQELYGAASDAFHAGDPTLADLGLMMSDYLNNIDGRGDLKDEPKVLTAKDAVHLLQTRLNKVFGEAEETIRVFESDGIVADAAAGADYIKIRTDALFNDRDVRALEVHEGLVHVGTTLNGLNQPICTFLSKGPPSSTVTQEGLAILMEIITFASYPSRLRKLTNRTRAIHMVEEGADFCRCSSSSANRVSKWPKATATPAACSEARRQPVCHSPKTCPTSRALSWFTTTFSWPCVRASLNRYRCCSAARPPWRTCVPCVNWSMKVWWCRRNTCRNSSAT